MHGVGSSLYVFLALLGGAALMPLLAARLRIPAPVLLILYGVLIGPHGLNMVHNSPVEGFLSELGFILLMFLAGLEIDFNGLRLRGPRTIAVLGVVSAMVVGLSMLAAWRMGMPVIQGLALGAISVGMPLALLKDSGHLRTGPGQNILLLGSIGEFLTVIAMTLVDLGLRHGATLAFLGGCLQLMGFLAVAGLVLRLLVALAWWRPETFGGLVREHASELGVRASLFAMAAFSVIAMMAGVEPIVGAFLAGTLIAFVLRGKEVLEEKLSVVGHGLFIPIFFVGVGLRFDPNVITGPNLQLAAILLVVVFTFRLVPSLLLVGIGLRWNEIVASSALLSCPLTLMVAIATLGAEVGVLDETQKGTMVLLAIASGVLFPLVFRWLARSWPREPEGRGRIAPEMRVQS